MKYIKYIFLFSALSLTSCCFAHERAVLVHGFMRSKGNMSAIESSLNKEGWQTTNWDYPSKKDTIEEHGKSLTKELRAIAKESPGKPIHFVTHSMGGLVVRSALNRADCPDEAKIGRAVLIAPPNRGSALARNLANNKLFKSFFGKHAGQQLWKTPSDGFDSLGSFPATKTVLVISGTSGLNPLLDGRNDGKVTVIETCLPTPHYHQHCRAGHSWICHSPRVVRMTKEFLFSKKINRQHCAQWSHAR